MHLLDFDDSSEPNEVTYAKGRLPTRLYISRNSPTRYGRDAGHPSRYISKVFDEVEIDDDGSWDWTDNVIDTTPGGRKQVTVQVARTQGAVRALRIQKVPTSGDLTRLEPLLTLNREQAKVFIETIEAIRDIPIEGAKITRLDYQTVRDVLADPDAASDMYSHDPARFRELIEGDAEANDVVALQRRRQVVGRMREWLNDDNAFQAAATEAGGKERAWQKVLEENPWILGIGLGGQLFTSWDATKLEKTVQGQSFKSVGKRADAVLRTAGIIQSLAFAEIKHHKTDLVDQEYRSGCWAPSKDLGCAIVQAQQTALLAGKGIEDYLPDETAEGERLPSGAYMIRPRSFVIIGTLAQLTGSSGGVLHNKFQSFELFRRSIHEPEIITFDELVARAEWHVESAAEASRNQAERGHHDAETIDTTDPWND